MGATFKESGIFSFSHLVMLALFLIPGLDLQNKFAVVAYIIFLFFWFVLDWPWLYAWLGMSVSMAAGILIFC